MIDRLSLSFRIFIVSREECRLQNGRGGVNRRRYRARRSSCAAMRVPLNYSKNASADTSSPGKCSENRESSFPLKPRYMNDSSPVCWTKLGEWY